MKKKILLYSPMSSEALQDLKNKYDVLYLDAQNLSLFNQQVKHHLPDITGIIGDGLEIDKNIIDQAEKLEVVSNISVGYDNLDIEELTKKGIIATNTPEVLTETTADLMFGLVLSSARKIAQLDRYVKNKKWIGNISWELMGVDVHRKTLGIVGMGKIGYSIAKRAHLGFNMPILYHNRTRNKIAEQELKAAYCSLNQLLQNSDFVCLMAPLTKETEGMIGFKELSLMKKSAILINGSRGKVINEKDLIEILESGSIKGAGLDVYENEPIPNEHPFLKMDQVVTLPHIGSSTFECKRRMDLLAVDNLTKAIKNEEPSCIINPGAYKNR